jgi:hypothetical protein
VASTTYSIRLDGTRQAIGPFPFTVRGITLQNRCVAGNLFAVDDRGSQQEATPLTAVNSKAEDTTYITCFIDSPQTSGSLTVIVSDTEPSTPIETSQLSTLGGEGAGSVIVPTVALASFPPATPQDGQMVELILPASFDPVGGQPIRWLCRFDVGTNAWHVAGAPLYAEVLTNEGTASGTYVDLATVGPSITLPRGGDYNIEIGCYPQALDSPGLFMSYQAGAAAASDTDAAKGDAGAAASSMSFNSARAREKTGLAASAAITAKYRSGTGGSGGFANRWMRIVPIRIT